MDEYNLFSSKCSFMKPRSRLWTFEYPTGARAQLDYILFRKKWRNSVKDSRSYSSFSSIGSDHRIVLVTIKLSLRSSKRSKPHPMKSIDWRKVAQDKNLSHQYAVEVKNRFELLHDEINQDNVDESYTTLSKLTQEVAEEMLPKKAKRAKYQPTTEICVEQAREKLKLISNEYHRSPTALLKVSLKLAKQG